MTVLLKDAVKVPPQQCLYSHTPLDACECLLKYDARLRGDLSYLAELKNGSASHYVLSNMYATV